MQIKTTMGYFLCFDKHKSKQEKHCMLVSKGKELEPYLTLFQKLHSERMTESNKAKQQKNNNQLEKKQRMTVSS